MAKKTIKKVDVKKVTKLEVSTKIAEMFEELGLQVDSGVDYGFTEGTLVFKGEKCDVQIKLITPKAGVERYDLLVEEEEEEEVEIEVEEGKEEDEVQTEKEKEEEVQEIVE